MVRYQGKFLLLILLLTSCVATPAGAVPVKHHKKHRLSLRARKVAKAFVSSSDLRPMTLQLMQSRTPAAYAGVEKYARAHAKDDTAPLAWLAIGYAHLLDRQYPESLIAFKKARTKAAILSDYVEYFTGDVQFASGDPAAAQATLKGFETRNPESILLRDAAVVQANSMLAQNNAAGAIAMLEGKRTPYRPDLELALGRAEAKVGKTSEAVAIFRRIYFSTPTAPEAAAADSELEKIQSQTSLAPPSFAERRLRAATLLEQHQAAQAAVEYRQLLPDTPPEGRAEITLDLANALSLSGRQKDELDLLRRMPDPGGELGARRSYYLLELSRSDPKQVADIVDQLRANAPTSPWFAEALLAAANVNLLRNDLPAATRFYAELVDRFPDGRHAPYSNWRAAWLAHLTGDEATSKTAIERQIESYPDSSEILAALYWGGRQAEDDHDLPKARAYYTTVAGRFGNDYYSALARARLHDLPAGGAVEDDPLLDKIGDPPSPRRFATERPEDNLQLQKSLLLENSGLTEYAARELRSAGDKGSSDWRTAELVRLYTESGRYALALETLKRAAPGYYSFSLAELPRGFWETLFPKPYWDQLKRSAAENKLDPFLVASLIRQESEFNPDAISYAQAIGLMQIVPSTGRKLAKEAKIRHFNESMLLDPNTNLELGARYLRHLLDKYDGQLEYALAAYNAGPEHVDGWKNGHYHDIHEFVESIPFTQTREYVEAILRNQAMYEQLYRTP